MNFGRKEGLLLDPLYNSKLFMTAVDILPKLEGNVLIIHSGGQLPLMGFKKGLSKQVFAENVNEPTNFD